MVKSDRSVEKLVKSWLKADHALMQVKAVGNLLKHSPMFFFFRYTEFKGWSKIFYSKKFIDNTNASYH